LIQAEVDGERLTSQELGSFFILLVVAGNETTRNAISHGMKALTDFPAARARWMADFDAIAPTAVEEIVRWATPVIHFRRTATRDVEVGGQTIRAGEKIVLWYSSANRDGRAVSIVPPGRFVYGLQLPVVAQSTVFAQPWEASAGTAEILRVARACDRVGFFYLAACDHVCVPRAQAAAMSTVWYDPVATL